MISIINIVILLFLLFGAVVGFKKGAITSLVNFIGTLGCIVLAFLLKNPLSVFMYTNLPFFNFGGVFEGITVLNVIIYEAIAFFIVLSVLFTILKLLLRISGIIETILNATIILGIPSKILGMIFGVIEAFLFCYIVLFIMNQIPNTKPLVEGSEVGKAILEKTPCLSSMMNTITESIDEIYIIAKDGKINEETNREAFEILIKNEILTTENARKLVESGKLEIDNADEIIKKYE